MAPAGDKSRVCGVADHVTGSLTVAPGLVGYFAIHGVADTSDILSSVHVLRDIPASMPSHGFLFVSMVAFASLFSKYTFLHELTIVNTYNDPR